VLINEGRPPEQSLDATRQALAVLAGRGRFATVEQQQVRAEDLQLTHPQQVYPLGLDDLAAGRGLAAARPAGWRFLVVQDGTPVALAETVARADGSHAIGQVNYGPFVVGTDRAWRTVENLDLEPPDELRLLHVPALYLVALWLSHAADPARDTLVPIAPTPSGIEPDRLYPAGDLIRTLAARAAVLAGVSDSEARGS
jgi:hypothetical protein